MMDKAFWRYILLVIFGLLAGHILTVWSPPQPAAAKLVKITTGGFSYQVVTYATDVHGLLIEQGLLSQPAVISREPEDILQSGMVIRYHPALPVIINDAGHKVEVVSTALTVGEILAEQDIMLNADDLLSPDAPTASFSGLEIRIDRMQTREETVAETLPFLREVVVDPRELYGQEVILQSGVEGRVEVRYSVRYKNGKEVSRKKLASQVTLRAQTEIVSQGSRIEAESYEYGRASWYVYKKCLCAAHPNFPMGSFLQVTDQNSGRSMIVTVNDRGPNQQIHRDRLIDLDAEAFRLLAPLSAGVVEVKVEKLKQ
ncbi:MAG: G5 domain-containing protein [Candidatus Doudnabacteria bacterium]|nr:G5 domain-containing protein [Candidatus Doudnabacteria bacterium]